MFRRLHEKWAMNNVRSSVLEYILTGSDCTVSCVKCVNTKHLSSQCGHNTQSHLAANKENIYSELIIYNLYETVA